MPSRVRTLFKRKQTFLATPATPCGKAVGSSCSTRLDQRSNSCGLKPSKFIRERSSWLLNRLLACLTAQKSQGTGNMPPKNRRSQRLKEEYGCRLPDDPIFVTGALRKTICSSSLQTPPGNRGRQ